LRCRLMIFGPMQINTTEVGVLLNEWGEDTKDVDFRKIKVMQL
jgi:hypothetical protein